MNKAIALLFVVVAAASCAGLAGCGSTRGGETAAPPAQEEEAAPAESEEEEAMPGVVNLKWGDIPVFATAEQTQKGGWAIPPAEGDWSSVEWRYYRMPDEMNSVVEVGRFYKNEMPKNGWQETMWLEVEDMIMSYYNKNGERDGAAVWIGSEEGHTVFALMRASQ